MPTIAELEAEYQRQLTLNGGKPPATPPAASPVQAPQQQVTRAALGPGIPQPGEVPVPDVSRALRTGKMLENQSAALADFSAADAFVRSKGLRTPASTNLPSLQEMIENARPALGTPVTAEQRAALAREQARRGVANIEDLPRGDGAASVFLERSALRYPMLGLQALLRPIDSGLPAAAKAVKEGKDARDVAIAVAAAMDPLGRFSEAGARGPAWSNPAPSWHGALPKGMQGTLPGAVAGLAGDVLLSPSTYLGARTLSGKGITFAGKTVVPDRVVSAVGGAPGRAVKAITPEPVRAMVARGGDKVKDVVGGAFDRFHNVSRIEDPAVREKMREIVMLAESARATQTAQATSRIEELLSGIPLERQRAIRDFIENPAAFDFDRPMPRAPFPARPTTALAKAEQVPAGLGEAIPPVPGQPSEIFVGAGPGQTTGPRTMFGQPAAPTAAPGVPDAKRYGAAPADGFQAPGIAPDEVEVAAWIENELVKARKALEERGLLTKGRANYFPRERSLESMQQARGAEARAESVGVGPRPAVRTQFGFQKRREELDWINEMLASVGKPPIEDTTSAVNAFWRAPPEELRARLGGKLSQVEESERFLDLPKEVLQRYLGKAVKSTNDYDLMARVAAMDDSAGRRLSRPFVRELRDRRVTEEFDVPQPSGYYDTGSGPATMRPGRAPPGAPQLPRGAMGRKGEGLAAPPQAPRGPQRALPGEVEGMPPAGAFEGVSPFSGSRSEREIVGYRVPRNESWRKAFPQQALPKRVADEIDRLGEPYWATEGFGRLVDSLVRVGHKVQLPWKFAATSGSGFRFALRNYYSQQMMNLQAYGRRSAAPWVQLHSHVLGLPDSALKPEALARTVTVGGQTYTYKELRDIAQQTGLWRTTVEAELWAGQIPGSGTWSQPLHASRSLEHKIGKGAKAVAKAVGPVNPFSRQFLPAKHAFVPFSEYTERQGRMAALLLELEQGKPIVKAAQDAAKTHVNYASFSAGFEKYGTLAYPFAKFGAGMLPNTVKWSLQHPGRSMTPERLFRAGESLVPEDERKRLGQEPRSTLEARTGARVMGWPGKGVLREPEVGQAKGDARLPYATLSPFPDTLLNVLGAPARIAGATDRSEQLATEVLEDAFPVFKAPYEWATGRNVFTGEPQDFKASQPAPRSVAAMYARAPDLAAKLFGAEEITDPRTGQTYLATPGKVNMVFRYLPNVSAFDLATAFLGAKKPYDNDTAIALRLLGLTQVLHDPLIPASQQARDNAKRAQQVRRTAESWNPAAATE